MLQEKYLPIGTVVLLKEGKQKLMINGYTPVESKNKDRVYDYCGCIYPEGVISTDQTILFDHNDIEEVLTLGFVCEEQEKLNQKLHELLSKEMPQEEMETLE